jgi:hypothetical protein
MMPTEAENRKNRFSDPTQGQTGKRDAQLAGAQIPIEVGKDVTHHPGPSVTPLNVPFQLGIPDLHQREFSRDEKPVESHQRQSQ